MTTRKFAISSNRFGALILSAAMSFGLILCWPLLAQTSEDTGKAKHAEGSYSSDQMPDSDVPSNDQVIKLLREQNARLKKENAQLKAELAKLKASK